MNDSLLFGFFWWSQKRILGQCRLNASHSRYQHEIAPRLLLWALVEYKAISTVRICSHITEPADRFDEPAGKLL
jgi:hypothetical protein